MMGLIMRTVIILGALWLACTPLPGPVPPPDTTIVDVTIVDAGPDPEPPAPAPPAPKDIFDLACENLRALHCREGFQQPGQEPCADVMRRAETEHLTRLYPEKVAAARSVAELRTIGRYCRVLVP